jgi:hypothetical protein
MWGTVKDEVYEKKPANTNQLWEYNEENIHDLDEDTEL